jgi:hypothetical protein
MTLINNINIDNIEYNSNEIRQSVIINEPIEDKLHVVAVVSNPCLYAIRYILMREFIKRMEMTESNVILYVVEMAYKEQKFIITDSNNSRHLQLRTEHPLWHKENMINLGIKKLLPDNWKAMAWIDADIEFENHTWAIDTLKILNGSKDVVQLFSHCVDMNKKKEAMQIFTSFGYQHVKKILNTSGPNFWHPGYAWACTRKAYEKMGGLYDKGILGAGDNVVAMCLIGKGEKGVYTKGTDGYKQTITEYEKTVSNLRVGYVPGVIRHHYHGAKKNRRYMERWDILVKHKYNPYIHVAENDCGILVPTPQCSQDFLIDIMNYFVVRNEDEDFVSLTSIHSVFKQTEMMHT